MNDHNPIGKVPPVIRTLEDLEAVVRRGETRESDVLEFKREIEGLRMPRSTPEQQRKHDEHRRETARDIAQFANGWGGCLLVGVSEDAAGAALEWAPLAKPEDSETWIRDVIKDWVVPSTLPVDITPVAVQGGAVLAVHVPASRELVAVWDRKKQNIEYVRRVGRGKKYLNPSEVEMALNDRTRSARIAYNRVLDRIGSSWSGRPVVELTPQPSVDSGNGLNTYVARTTDDELVLHVCVMHHGEIAVHVPWSLVEDAWVTADNRCGLLLRARVHCSTGRTSRAWLDIGPLY